jgi:hypothetical protein
VDGAEVVVPCCEMPFAVNFLGISEILQAVKISTGLPDFLGAHTADDGGDLTIVVINLGL